MKNRIINNRYQKIICFQFCIGVFLVVLFSLIFLFWYNQSRIILGINLPHQKIGGTKIEKVNQVLDKYSEELGNINVLVGGENKSFITNFKNLGIILAKEKTKKKLISIGHRGGVIKQFISQVKILFFGQRINPVIIVNENKFRALIKKNLPGLEMNIQNAAIKYSPIKKSFEVLSSQSGQRVKMEVLLSDIYQIVNQTQEEVYSLQLKTKIIQPKIKTENILHLVSRANKIIGKPILIIGDKKIFRLNKDLIASWIIFPIVNGRPELSFDREKINNYLVKISSKINQSPINAQVIFKNEKVKIFQLAHWGKTVDIQRSISEIEDGLRQRRKKIKLIIDLVKPLITTNQDIEKLGIKNLLAVGESDFSGSPRNRIHNIKTGATKISGVLIAPNEEFSFNQNIGEINKKNGYLPELVIKNHQVIPELGGGLCQVSTTIFRAAVRAGLIITERQPHAFPVIYYYPQGFDATVYNGSPDLKFVNNTPNYLLIQTKIKNNHLYVYLYGTNDNRRVEVVGPEIVKNTLKIKREGKWVDNPRGVLKTILTEKVWLNGRMVYQKQFWSIYHSPLLFGE